MKIPSRSTSPKGEGKIPYWNWIRGNYCKGKDCKFQHDPKVMPKKGASATINSGEHKPKSKPLPKPKPKGKPGAPAMGDSFILEEPDDEGIAISMRTNTNKKKKVSFSINIIFHKIIYSTHLI